MILTGGIVIDVLLSALRRVSSGGHGEQHARRPPVSFFELAVAHPATPPCPSPHKHQALKTPTAINKRKCVASQSETRKEELVSMCVTNRLVAAGSELTVELLQAKCKCRAMEVSGSVRLQSGGLKQFRIR